MSLKFLTKPKAETGVPPPRSAADIAAALTQLEAKLPEYEQHVANAALLAADAPTEEATAALKAALSAQADHNSAIGALRAAHGAALRRDADQVAAKQLDVLSGQADRVTKLLERRERVSAELSAALETAADAFRRLLDLSQRAAIAHVAGDPTKAMLTYALGEPQVKMLVANEVYRLGGFQPRLGGSVETPSFPGAIAPHRDVPPERTPALVDVIKAADDAAIAAQNAKLERLRAAAGRRATHGRFR